jgi:2-dehydro-3-deoxyphosphogluconate aldolase / (4S)-4-hydroxy-2-oxoglutarate aldolase
MASMNIRSLLALAPVIPVLTIESVEDAVPLGRALCAGGLRALEITLRTPACLPAIEALRKALPEALVGVGTLTRSRDFVDASNAGAQFGVSPGLTADLAAAAAEV